MSGWWIAGLAGGAVVLLGLKLYWDRRHCLGCIWRRLQVLRVHRGEYRLLRQVDCLPSAPPVDFLVISRYGVFPVFAKFCPGRIQGRREDAVWQQRGWETESEFPNPLEALVAFAAQFAEAADIPTESVHPVVVLTGCGRFLHEPPGSVCRPSGLVAFIRMFGGEALSAEEMEAALRLACGGAGGRPPAG